jgi:hypothetical protein
LLVSHALSAIIPVAAALTPAQRCFYIALSGSPAKPMIAGTNPGSGRFITSVFGLIGTTSGQIFANPMPAGFPCQLTLLGLSRHTSGMGCWQVDQGNFAYHIMTTEKSENFGFFAAIHRIFRLSLSQGKPHSKKALPTPLD